MGKHWKDYMPLQGKGRKGMLRGGGDNLLLGNYLEDEGGKVKLMVISQG